MNRKTCSELVFWRDLYKKFTKNCKPPEEKIKAEMAICWKITFPRYCKDLYVDENSFKGKTVLDVGCGPHGGLIGFKDCDAKYGIDPLIRKYEEIGYPLSCHHIQYFNYPIEDIPFSDKTIDIITCVNAIDHVDDIEKAFTEMSRVLKPKGFILGQFMFHDIPDVVHPICLNHEKIKDFCASNSLIVKECRYQREGTGKKESIYFYRIQKA